MDSTRTLVASALAIAVVAPALPAQSFEGTVHYRQISVSDNGVRNLLGTDPQSRDAVDPQELFAVPIEKVLDLKETSEDDIDVQDVTFQMKGTKLRVESPQGYAIMDIKTGITWLVSPQSKSYIEFTTEDMKAAQKQAEAMREEAMKNLPEDARKKIQEQEKASAASPDVRELGRSGTVNGLKAAAYELKKTNEVSIGWVTQEHKDLTDAFRAFAEWSKQFSAEQDRSDNAEMTLTKYGLPVRTQTLDQTSGGYDVTDMLSVDAHPVAEDLFQIPDGYTKQTLPGLPGGS